MIQEYAQVGFGLIILLFAGDALVRGAVNLSLRLGIPALIVSLTIVAFGTSAPELLIAVSAVLEEAPGIAVGNVVGSNIANVLLVLGLPALISGLHTSTFGAKKSYVFMLAASGVFIAGAFLGPIMWIHGLIFLAVLGFILADAIHEARAHRRDAKSDPTTNVEGADPSMRGWKIAAFLIAGLIGLPLGAELLVEGAVDIARDLGIREAVIGLTLVAIGTSLPELATTVVAAFRRNADVAIGNVIGSNMFNVLAITGIASLVGPIPVDQTILGFDIWVMLGASIVLAPFVLMKIDMGRRVGTTLVLLYGAYIASILI